MEYLKLIGIVIIVVGFMMNVNSAAVVVISAVATAAFSGIAPLQILDLIGKGFMENRVVTLFFLTLPMIGLMERYGMKIEATRLIKKIKSLTAGRIMDAYNLLHEICQVASIPIQGPVQFIRPIINPMAQAATRVKTKLTPKKTDEIKSVASADDNIGNVFSQDLSIVTGGDLLIVSTMKSLGHSIDATQVILYSIPAAVVAFIAMTVYNHYFDKHLLK